MSRVSFEEAMEVHHVTDLVGIDQVAIGADHDGMGSKIPIVPDVSQLPILTQAMMERGRSGEVPGAFC